MSTIVNKQSYHDYLVEQIKAAGQEIINRAEAMISEDSKFMTDFNINIHIPNKHAGEAPTISWTNEAICKAGMEAMMGEELD